MEDFSNAPISLGEIRANKLQRADEWSVRDMLVSMLRDIDSGEKPAPSRAVIVFQRDEPDGLPVTGHWIAGANRTTSLGMLETVKFQLFGEYNK